MTVTFTRDMAILMEAQLSENQGMTPEGYLVCRNVPVARIGVQTYLGQELGLSQKYGERVKVYRLPEDVFEEEALRSLESKPITDDHPRDLVTIHNAGYLAMGHGRNVRHDTNHVICDLMVMNQSLIDGIRAKRKYNISLGYTANYVPYKDGYKQTNIRINHIAVVEVGRAGPKVSIKDKAPSDSQNRRKHPMNKREALAAMFAAYAKDADPQDIVAVLPFVTDAEPATATKDTDKSDKGMMGLLAGLLARDAKPAETKTETLTADAVKKMIADGIAEALKGLKSKDSEDHPDEKEDKELIEKMLKEKETGDEDTEGEEKATEDEDSEEESEEEKKTDDAAFAGLIQAIRPLYSKLPKAEQKKVTDALVKARRKPTADAYTQIIKAVQTHTKDAETIDSAAPKRLDSISKRVMAKHNPHYTEKA